MLTRSKIELLEDVQRLEHGHTRAARRCAVDVVVTIGGVQRLEPAGVIVGKILDCEQSTVALEEIGELLRERSAVERGWPARADCAQCAGEVRLRQHVGHRPRFAFLEEDASAVRIAPDCAPETTILESLPYRRCDDEALLG